METIEIAPQKEKPEESPVLERAYLELPYIPDFLLDEVQFWFAPTRKACTAVYHQLIGQSAKDWESFYTKRGWSFIHDLQDADGPYRITSGGTHLKVLDPGRIFAPKPLFRFEDGGEAIPIVSLQKRRPLNPWKPNYIQALNFIKRYEWPHPLPRSVQHAIWEIEECGQVAGSTSWRNAEPILRDFDSKELRLTLTDIFFNRPEDYPLGSEVYLRVLGSSGERGFEELRQLAKHPVSRKRKIVAKTLGKLANPQGVKTLLELLDDEEPEVRGTALRALGKLGVDAQVDPEGKVAAYLESTEIPKRVWAAQALCKGGDESQEKYFLALVKEEPRLLTDMGELGEVLSDLGLIDAVPYLINRLKHEKSEFRADAAEALEKLTHLGLEYHSVDSEEERRTAIKTYTRWWEERKKERRLERGGGAAAS
jgi:hypothetical protein